MSEIKNVLIAGAGGNLGPAIVNEFLAVGKFNVFVTSRPDSKATFPSGVKVIKTDYSPASLRALFEKQPIDAVISNLGGAAVGDVQNALIDASKAGGVKRFFPSEFGSDTTNPDFVSLVPIAGGKVQAIEYLKKVQTDTFTWTGVVTGAFLDWALEVGMFPVKIKEQTYTKWDGGDVPFGATTLATIGKALVSSLSSPAKLSSTANKFIYITSYTITLNELFAAAQKFTPGETWTVDEVDSEVAIKKGREDFAKGDFNGAITLLIAGVFSKAALGDYRTKGLSNEALGLPKQVLEDDVKRIVGKLTGKQ